MKNILNRFLFICLFACSLSCCLLADNFTKVPLWGGDVQTIAVSPSDPNIIYVGSSYCGSYVSKDAGRTWSSLTGGYGGNYICVHPTLPGTVFMGAMRSADYGATWTSISTSDTGSTNRNEIKIIASKTTTNKFYFLTKETGNLAYVYSSTDGGATWGNKRAVNEGVACWMMSMDVNSNDEIFVTISDDLNIYGTLNSGSLWKATADGVFSKVRTYDFRPNLIQISSNTVLVNKESNSQNHGKTCDMSIDGGQTFLSTTSVMTDPTARFLSHDGSKMYYYGSYNSGRDIFVSTGPNFDNSSIFSSSTPISYTSMGARPGFLVSIPQDPNIFYMTNSELGVIKSTDAGATWSAANEGMGGITALDGCKDSAGNMYVLGNLTLYKGTNVGASNESWRKLFCPDEVYGCSPRVGGIVTAPTSSVVLYATRAELFRSTDSGATWSYAKSFTWTTTGRITDVVYNKNNPSICYFSYSSGTVNSASSGKFIYKSTDTGATWTQMDLTGNSIQSLAIDPSDPTILYAGVGDMKGYGGTGIRTYGGMWKIVDDGVNAPVKTALTGLSSYIPYKIVVDTGGVVLCACESAASENDYYAVDPVMYSTDKGQTWNNTGLQSNCIIDIAYSNSVYYIATAAGVYTTLSLGHAFTKLTDTNSSISTIHCLIPGSMYSGANEGLFKISVTGRYYGTDDIKVYNYPNPFNPKTGGTTYIKLSIRNTAEDIKIKIYSLSGDLVSEDTYNNYTGGYSYTFVWDGKNQKGELCAPGVYFVVADVDGEKVRNKIVLVR